MQILIQWPGWSLGICGSNKLQVMSMLLGQRPQFGHKKMRTLIREMKNHDSKFILDLLIHLLVKIFTVQEKTNLVKHLELIFFS
jgi:hypothetical protein